MMLRKRAADKALGPEMHPTAGLQPGQKKLQPAQIWSMRMLVSLGFLALFNYARWWFADGRLNSPWMVILFAAALGYAGMQLASNWWLYLFAHRQPSLPPSQPDLSVDVFVTIAGEPAHLVAPTIAAACAMRGAHCTWVLDDASDPAMAELAAQYGAGYLTRTDRKNAKAGNMNAALEKTQGDILVIFDVDHIPKVEFLECSLGYFSDPQIGFVQVMLTFNNYQDSWVAQAAIETSLDYYNPASLGANGIGGTSLMGSNALIRRSALESIGGYQPGLAEDLATSLALHAAGWKSAYVAEPLAPGLAPPSFSAWFIQQLKWARGVFELLYTEFPRRFFRLTWSQRLSYSVRMTKYWIGPVVGVHLLATILALTVASAPVRDAFHSYLYAIAPLAIADVVIRHAAFRIYRHPETPKTSFALALALVYATWPVYILAWGMAILRLPLGFRPTPKTKTGKLNPVWFIPQITALLFIIAGFIYTVFVSKQPPSILLAFAGVQGFLQLFFLQKWLASSESFKLRRLAAGSFSPVAVVEVEIQDMPDEIHGLDAYEEAFVLVDVDRHPVTKVIVGVQGGKIAKQDLLAAIVTAGDKLFWQHWTRHLLGLSAQIRRLTPLPGASIAICTRDRPHDLERCLAAITRLADLGQEVLVVDSCSAGEATRLVAARYPQVRYVREAVPGLDRARNRAIREAAYEIVAFIDDDAIPDADWLPNLLRNFESPRVLCVTGLTMPLELETLAQQWFERYSPFGRGFTRQVWDKSRLHPLAAGRAGAGVNMAVRKQVLECLGPFNEALDVGTPTRSGGDTELFSRILAQGYQIVYDPAALSWHRHRRSWEELRQTIYGYGVGTYAYWTSKLLEEQEWSVIVLAWQWAWGTQIPRLMRALLRLPGGMPVDLQVAEIRGCLRGPWAYLASRKYLRAQAEGVKDGS